MGSSFFSAHFHHMTGRILVSSVQLLSISGSSGAAVWRCLYGSFTWNGSCSSFTLLVIQLFLDDWWHGSLYMEKGVYILFALINLILSGHFPFLSLLVVLI